MLSYSHHPRRYDANLATSANIPGAIGQRGSAVLIQIPVDTYHP
jgi:hypothetical protein